VLVRLTLGAAIGLVDPVLATALQATGRCLYQGDRNCRHTDHLDDHRCRHCPDWRLAPDRTPGRNGDRLFRAHFHAGWSSGWRSETLQIVFAAVLFALAPCHDLERTKPARKSVGGDVRHGQNHHVFCPIGAFGGDDITIGKYGTRTVFDLSQLVLAVNLVSILFVIVVLGLVLKLPHSISGASSLISGTRSCWCSLRLRPRL